MSELSKQSNGSHQQPDRPHIEPVDPARTGQSQIIIDGVQFFLPEGNSGPDADALNERLEANNFERVEIWLGDITRLTPRKACQINSICQATRGRCQFVDADGSACSSPVSAIAAGIARSKVGARVRNIAIQLASAWFDGDVETIRSELEVWLQGSRIKVPDNLEQLVARTVRRLNTNSDDAPCIADLLEDPSIDPDIRLPANWCYDKNADRTYRMEGPVRGESVDFFDGVLYVAEKFVDVEQDLQVLELVWKSHGRTYRTTVGRERLVLIRGLESLASGGLPVSSVNSRLLVTYFFEFLRANEFRIPCRKMVGHLGWIDSESATTFLLGGMQIAPSDMTMPFESVSPNKLDPAVMKISLRFSVGGNRDKAHQLLKEISSVPVVWFSVCAAMASPLLRILDISGFLIDICGETSAGKTTTMMLAGAIWGNPDIVETDSVIVSWDLTRVYGERLASIIHSLPVFLDDSRRAPKPEVITQMCYDLTGGKGKGRGNPTSVDVQRSWNLVTISTGEQSLTSFADQPGMRARIITLRGYPFPERNEEWRRRIEGWVTSAKENYGHMGREFIQYLANSHSRWPEWKQRCHQIMEELSPSIATNAVAGRHLSYLAAITLTAELACELWSLPEGRLQPVAGVRQLIANEYGEADRPREALEKVLDYVFANPQLVAESSGFGAPIEPPIPTSYIGMWIDCGKSPTRASYRSLAITSQQFDRLMAMFELSRDEILTSWVSRNWLHLGEGNRPLKQVRFKRQGNGTVRAVCIRAETIAEIRPFNFE